MKQGKLIIMHNYEGSYEKQLREFCRAIYRAFFEDSIFRKHNRNIEHRLSCDENIAVTTTGGGVKRKIVITNSKGETIRKGMWIGNMEGREWSKQLYLIL